MSKEIATKMSPEGLEIANTYLEQGNIPAVCSKLGVSESEVSEILNKREIKQYIGNLRYAHREETRRIRRDGNIYKQRYGRFTSDGTQDANRRN